MRKQQMEELLSQLQKKRPLLLTGTPGVGKSFFAKELAKKSGLRYFLLDLSLDAAFCETIKREGFLQAAKALPIKDNKDVLFVLDSVQHLGREALQTLLLGELPDYLIMTAGRRDWFFGEDALLLPDGMRAETILPYSFFDFLLAMGNEWYLDVLWANAKSNKPIPPLVLEELNDCLYDYLLTGGYPAVVQTYLEKRGDLGAIYAAQKHAYAAIALELFWDCALPSVVSETRLRQLVSLLAKSADRMQPPNFLSLRRGAAKSQYAAELSYLLNNALIFPVGREGRQERYEFLDSGLLRYLRTDYEHFLQLEETPCPKYILQQYVYSTLWRNQIPVQDWRSKRGAQISFFSADGRIAIDCKNKQGGYRRNAASFLKEHPQTKLYTCGLSPDEDILYVSLPAGISAKFGLDAHTLLM